MKTTLPGLASGPVVISLLANYVDPAFARPMPKSSSAYMRKNHSHRGGPHHRMKRQTTGSSCASPNSQSIVAPKSNIWSGLTNIEAAAVTAWLFGQSSLNLTVSDKAGEWDNSIVLVELNIPNKTESLAYFDAGGAAPERYAHVVLDNRATETPYYEDLLVGPLPLKNETAHYKSLEYPFTKKTAGRIRNLDADYDNIRENWVMNITASITDITQELFGGTVLGNDDDVADVWEQDPLWQDDGIIHWYQFWGTPTDNFDEETLLPLGLYFSGNITGRDPKLWNFEGWLYNNVFYATTEEFRTAFFSPGFEKLEPNVGGPWASTDQRGDIPELDTLSPPVALSPMGSRYFVDEAERYVKWMDFEFYITFTRDTGMRIFDIKYKGERIIYELGLQEALAHYAGNDPFQSGTAYLDSYYGFGPYSFQLVPGYDCPSYATYLNSSYYTDETTHTHIDSICLFESTADYPLQRHSTSAYVSVTRNALFTVRNVCTVGNYDYMFSYSFYMDGSLHVEVRASGYIQSAYWAHNGDYGHQIHDALSGSMHDHVLNFKLDMDVLGTANTLTTTTLVPVTEVYPWSKGKPRNTMKLERGAIENEDDGKIMWPSNGATEYTIVNQNATNQYGVPRGYRIMPSSGTIHLTVENSSNLANSANWASHDFFVTKQKDTEPRSAHAWNSQDVYDPMINFNAFFDSEDLIQEDLVIWFNLGMHHVPHTGDLPNTVFTTAHSGLSILPLNYLAGSPSVETVNMVRIDYSGGNTSYVETFGQAQSTCSASLGSDSADLYKYTGDVVIRKFPFDPNDPYFETDGI